MEGITRKLLYMKFQSARSTSTRYIVEQLLAFEHRHLQVAYTKQRRLKWISGKKLFLMRFDRSNGHAMTN